MSLAKELLQKVKEAKQAEDEMSIPTYDDMKTPNNHVANSSNATKERKVTGLGDRVEKKPTADIGTPHNEKGRKMSEADMQVPGHRSGNPGMNPIQALGIYTDGGLLHFNHPNAEDQVYSIEYNQELHKFLQNTLKRTGDAGQVFDLLHQWYEEGEGNDPQNMVGLNASKGSWPMSEATADNPIVQALGMRKEGNAIRMTSPDGSAGIVFRTSPAIDKAINGYITSPDARANTTAAADRLFKMLGKQVPGVQAVAPQQVQGSAAGSGGYQQAAGGDIDTSGMSMQPMESKGHKTADGEMNKPTIKAGVPAKTAKVRGKQNDEPKNKGNPGSSKEEKGQTKPQFTVSPKDYKGGENEHKSMKKMHETKKSLEQLLGRELNLSV